MSVDDVVTAAEAAVAADADLDVLAARLHEIRAAKARLAETERDLEAHLARQVKGQQVRAGNWRLEKRGGKDRTAWQSESILNELIRRSNVDPETGELLPPAEARERLIAALRACAPLTESLQWRIKPLRSWGIDPDQFAEVKSGKTRVEVHLVDHEDDEETTDDE